MEKLVEFTLEKQQEITTFFLKKKKNSLIFFNQDKCLFVWI